MFEVIVQSFFTAVFLVILHRGAIHAEDYVKGVREERRKKKEEEERKERERLEKEAKRVSEVRQCLDIALTATHSRLTMVQFSNFEKMALASVMRKYQRSGCSTLCLGPECEAKLKRLVTWFNLAHYGVRFETFEMWFNFERTCGCPTELDCECEMYEPGF